MEKERQRRLQEDFAAQDLNRYRREQIVASYAHFQQGSSVEMNSVNYSQPQAMASVKVASQPAVGNSLEQTSRPDFHSNFEGLNSEQVSGIFEQAAKLVRPASPRNDHALNHSTSAGEAAAAAASYRKQTNHAASQRVYENIDGAGLSNESNISGASVLAADAAPLLNVSSPSISDRLGAADALSALAALADATASVNAKSLSASTNASGVSSFAYGFTAAPSAQIPSAETHYAAASHGFGGSMDAASFGDAKRGIPSYAQINGEGTTDGTVKTYVWPPRRDD
jgi:hypothetical protein